MDINERLRKAIKSAVPVRYENFTALAKAAGISQGSLNLFMNGKRDSMQWDTAWKILDKLEYSFISPSDEDPYGHPVGEHSSNEQSNAHYLETIADLERRLSESEESRLSLAGEVRALERQLARLMPAPVTPSPASGEKEPQSSALKTANG